MISKLRLNTGSSNPTDNLMSFWGFETICVFPESVFTHPTVSLLSDLPDTTKLTSFNITAISFEEIGLL